MAIKEIPVEEARDRPPLGLTPTSAEICLLTTCGDRVQVEDTIANTNIPAFITSATEGFCITFVDVRNTSPEAHVRLNIVDDIPVGGWRADCLALEIIGRIANGVSISIRCTMSGEQYSKSA